MGSWRVLKLQGYPRSSLVLPTPLARGLSGPRWGALAHPSSLSLHPPAPRRTGTQSAKPWPTPVPATALCPPSHQECPVLMPGAVYAATAPPAQAADQTLSQPTRHRPEYADSARPEKESYRPLLSQADSSPGTSALELLVRAGVRGQPVLGSNHSYASHHSGMAAASAPFL